MGWLAVLFSDAGRALGAFLASAATWGRKHPWQALAGFLLAISAILFWAWRGAEREADAYQRQAVSAGRALRATVKGYRAAAEIAERRAQVNVERVRREGAAIAERVKHDYETRIADLDARADRVRLRLDRIETHPGGPGTAAVPYDSEPACRALGAADCDGLVARLKDAQASIDRLIGWQQWWAGVNGITINLDE